MSRPDDREIRQVSKIVALNPQEIETLREILMVLGFGTDTIAIMWGKGQDFVADVFGARGLNGAELAELCVSINLRPGVVQRRLNFNECPPPRQKRGFKSTPVPTEWVGPPELCIAGSNADGKAFKELYLLPGVAAEVPPRSQLDKHVLQQIGDGKSPVRLQTLRDVLMVVERLHPNAKKLKRLQDVLGAFPDGIRSVEDVFAPATASPKPGNRPQEGRIMLDTNDQAFVDRWKAAELGPLLVELIEDQCLNGWVHEELDWDDDVINHLNDNDAGPLERELETLWRKLTEPDAFHKTRSAFEGIQSHLTKWGCAWAMLATPEPTVGKRGETWYHDQNLVVVGNTKLTVRGSHKDVASKRVYRTLQSLLEPLGLKWPDLYGSLGMARDSVVSLSEGKCRLGPEWVESVLVALKSEYQLELSLEQLFGLASVPVPESAVAVPTTESASAQPASSADSPPPVRTPLPDVSAETAAFGRLDQPATARFIEAFTQRDPARGLLKTLQATGITFRPFNQRVIDGSQRYSRQQLERIAEHLGISYDALTTADESVLPEPPPVAPEKESAAGDQRKMAYAIARIAKGQGKKMTAVMALVGENRRHNAMVMEDPTRYSYTEEQLAILAKHLEVSVAALKDEESPGEHSLPVTAPQSPSSEGDALEVRPTEHQSTYDAGNRQQRGITATQLKRLAKHLRLSGAAFVEHSGMGVSAGVLYEQVRIERYMLDRVIKAFGEGRSWLSVEWLTTDTPVPTDEPTLASVPTLAEAAPAAESTGRRPAVESAPAEPEPTEPSVPESAAQTTEAEGEALLDAEPDIELRLRSTGPLDHRLVFLALAEARLVGQRQLITALRAVSDDPNSHDWEHEIVHALEELLGRHPLLRDLIRTTEPDVLSYLLSILTKVAGK